MSPALAIRDLTVRYADTTAVDQVSLVVNPGEVVAILGANGAGKTSLVEAAIGLRHPSAGTVQALGQDPSSASVRERTGVMLQNGGLYPSARPLAWLTYLSKLYPNAQDPSALLRSVGIDPRVRTLNRRLSGGEQQRVKLAAALLPTPDLLYLDEPTAGVDALGREDLIEIVRIQARRGAAVVLTTHVLADVEDLADRIVVLVHGRVRAEGTLGELTDAATAVRFTAQAALKIDELTARLGLPYRAREVRPGAYVVEGPVSPDALAAITQWCAEQGVLAQGLSTGRLTLLDLLAESAAVERPGGAA